MKSGWNLNPRWAMCSIIFPVMNNVTSSFSFLRKPSIPVRHHSPFSSSKINFLKFKRTVEVLFPKYEPEIIGGILFRPSISLSALPYTTFVVFWGGAKCNFVHHPKALGLRNTSPRNYIWVVRNVSGHHYGQTLRMIWNLIEHHAEQITFYQ